MLKVDFYFVGSDQVDVALQQFDPYNTNPPTVPRTMTLHQLFANSPGYLMYSCFYDGVSTCCDLLTKRTLSDNVTLR